MHKRQGRQEWDEKSQGMNEKLQDDVVIRSEMNIKENSKKLIKISGKITE